MLFFLNLSRGLGLHYFNHGLRHLGLVHASRGDVSVVTLKVTVDVSLKVSLKET